jgi:glyoxylase-like metal-dependent hydrolase (beta-lactamase superfamily II)
VNIRERLLFQVVFILLKNLQNVLLYSQKIERTSNMLRKLTVGAYQANCYILGCKSTGTCAVIDPGAEILRIMKEITNNQLRVKYILITHGHMDHTGGALELHKATGAPVFIHSRDAPGLGFSPQGTLAHGQQIHVGTYPLTVLHTPGHSPGGVCFHAPGAVFTGDTLFAGSIGRTDFPGGSHERLIRGVISHLFPLGDDLRIYPGHGPASTIGNERRTNPFFQQGAAR